MRKTISLLASIALMALAACSSDQQVPEVPLADGALRFAPTAGGAVLRYTLPADPDVVGIHVRYTDCYDQPMLRTASINTDSLRLVGFNEAQQNVPCQISLQLRNGEETKPVEASFSTLDSTPLQFINSVKVESGWNGFSINYTAPDDVEGIFHVFYIGENPYTHEPDSVLIDSKTITAGGDTLVYQPKQLKEQNTIVMKVEDYRGHTVKQREWQVEAMQTARHDVAKIYYDNSIEDPVGKLGIEYLTDGDLNGWRWFESQDAHKSYTFISNLHAVGEGSDPMYVDIGEVIPTAEVRLYAYVFNGGYNTGPCGEGIPCWSSTYCRFVETNYAAQMLNSSYHNRLPCSIDVYACREAGASTDFEHMKWEKIGSFDEPPSKPQTDLEGCWFNGSTDTRYPEYDTSAEDCKKRTPKYMSINFMAAGQGTGFRYLKLVFNKTYENMYGEELETMSNALMRVLTFNELEVYTKKK